VFHRHDLFDELASLEQTRFEQKSRRRSALGKKASQSSGSRPTWALLPSLENPVLPSLVSMVRPHLKITIMVFCPGRICTIHGFGWLVRSAARVATWHIFKVKIPIWVNSGGSCNGRCWYFIWPLGLVYGYLVEFVGIEYVFMVIWYSLKALSSTYMLWLFGIFFPFW
jgi:hypothetical protein